MERLSAKFVVIGGGIAGVTCAETLSALSCEEEIVLVTASPVIKTVQNFKQISKTMEVFDVEEKPLTFIQTECPNVQVIQKCMNTLNSGDHELKTSDGTRITYEKLCICTGGKPKMILTGNPHVLGIRDTESVKEFQKKLSKARRIIVIGNGGIATELVYEVEGCEVIWGIKDESIVSTFVDAGAAKFFLFQLNKSKDKPQKPLKRMKYQLESSEGSEKSGNVLGGALGPDWSENLEMSGMENISHKVHVKYKVEVQSIMTPEEFQTSGKAETMLDTTEDRYSHKPTDPWPVYVEFTDGNLFGCDLVVSATGVEPNIWPFLDGNSFDVADDGGLKVNKKMQTSIADIYAAGDCCTASWEIPDHWLQMRLWSQARQMGNYAAKCMLADINHEDIEMDFCFDLFSHVTKFFNFKIIGDLAICWLNDINYSLMDTIVIHNLWPWEILDENTSRWVNTVFYFCWCQVVLLGKFNAQGLGNDYELLLRITEGEEYVKVILKNNHMQGCILIGETDMEETFENLILNQMDLKLFKDNLLNPNIDIDDFFD